MRVPAIRSTKGAGIVEGVVGLALVIGSTVLAVLLLVNAGAAAYNKEKIALVAQQAATYASILPNDTNRQALVETMVDAFLDNMGINSANTTVTVSDINLVNREAIEVTVTTSLSTLLSGNAAAILPLQINISDKAVAIKNPWYGAYGIGVMPFGSKFSGCLINNTGVLPADGLPAWQMDLVSVWKIR